ncbi:MAG TPA: hypothetical protein VLF20_04980 [Patescibacteria group bacterium]|nr:hypothetical protein [Patescibacteria group bacterium]
MAKKESEKTVVVKKNYGGGGGTVYGIGLIGALVFYLSNATTFWEGALGVLKALVWPAFVVYGLLDLLSK